MISKKKFVLRIAVVAVILALSGPMALVAGAQTSQTYGHIQVGPDRAANIKTATDVIDKLHESGADRVSEVMAPNNLDGGFAWKTNPMLLGYVYAYEATGDTKYLDWFDEIVRGDSAGKYAGQLNLRDDSPGVQRVAYDGKVNPTWSVSNNATYAWTNLQDIRGDDLIKLTGTDYNYNNQIMVAIWTATNQGPIGSTTHQYMMIKTNPLRPTTDRAFTCYGDITYNPTDTLRPNAKFIDFLNSLWRFKLQYGGQLLTEETINPAYQKIDDGTKPGDTNSKTWRIYRAPKIQNTASYMSSDNRADFSILTDQQKYVKLPPADGVQATDDKGQAFTNYCFADSASEVSNSTNTIDLKATLVPFYSLTPYVSPEITTNGLIDLALTDYARVVHEKNPSGKYQTNADLYVSKVKENIKYFVDKGMWKEPEISIPEAAEQGWFTWQDLPFKKFTNDESLPGNRQAAFLSNYANLFEVTGDASYKDWPSKFTNWWKARAEVNNDGGYSWCYSNRWDSEVPPSCMYEDRSHATFDLDFFLRAYNNKIGMNSMDIQHFLITHDTTLVKKGTNKTWWYVNGTGDPEGGWPIWFDLAQYDREVGMGAVDKLNGGIDASNSGQKALAWGDIYWFGDLARFMPVKSLGFCDRYPHLCKAITRLPMSGTNVLILLIISTALVSIGYYFKKKIKNKAHLNIPRP